MTFEDCENQLLDAANYWAKAVNDAKSSGFTVKVDLCGDKACIYSFDLLKRKAAGQ